MIWLNGICGVSCCVCVCPSIVCVCVAGHCMHVSTCSLMANRIEGSEQSDVNDYCGNGGERVQKGGDSHRIDWFAAAALLLMRPPASAPAPPLSLPSSALGIYAFCFSLEFEKLLRSGCDRRGLFLFSWKRLWFGFLFLCLPHPFIRRRQCFHLRCNLL